jgi:predicted RNA-binding Zn-ribbon protein involved in translation (DUF1610 family)
LSGLKGLPDKLFKIRHRAPKPVFCPKCGSHKMKVKESYGILPHMYTCTECGYEGPLFLEIEEEE